MRHPHLAPPLLPTAGEGRTEGGGEGRQGGWRAYLVKEEEERGRPAGRPADLRAGGRPTAEGVQEGGGSARG
jgi:hypothetical protein